MQSMHTKNDDDTRLIAFCGLYCGDCHGYAGRIPDLARDLRKELRKVHYDRFASFIATYPFGKDFKNFDECYKVLGAMVKFRCKKGCRGGGGSPFCKIRKCVQKKELDGCWECPNYTTCENLQFLVPVHGEAHIKNLNRLKKKGTDEFLNGPRLWFRAKK
jgi:hypothetical protein